MFLRQWLILLLTLLPSIAFAQVDEALEDWMEENDNSQAAAEVSDYLLQLQAQPVNLNDTATISTLPFLNPFQLQALRNYILLHGQLLSHKELRFIPGFDSITILLLEKTTLVAPYQEQHGWRLQEGRHSLVTGIGGTAPQADGYRNGKYEGDNLHSLLCYTYKLHNHLQLRLTADKDPMEAWGKNNYYGYHLILNDIGHLERVIIGRYNLQFGQGLTLWSGLRPFNLTGVSPMRFGTGIRPAAAFYEENYQEGAAARIRLNKRIRLSAFASHVEGTTLTGGHLDYRQGNLIIGITTSFTFLRDSLTAHDYVYNQLRFKGEKQINNGIDIAYQWQRMTFFGEAALGENGSTAVMGGMQLQADSRNRFGISYRHYSKEYHNLYAQGYAIGNTQGEEGVTLDAENRLPFGITLLSSLDLHRFDNLRYATYSPTSGAWLRLQAIRPWGKYTTTSIRYTYRQKERNIPNLDTTLYLGEENLRQLIQGEIRQLAGPLTLTARGAFCRYDSDNGTPQQGWLASMAARYTCSYLQVSSGITYYDINGYYARIYLSESNLQYAWSMPSLYGRGWRGHLLLRYQLSQHYTLAAKAALTWMPGEEALGNGDSRTEGPVRLSWFVQLRCTL